MINALKDRNWVSCCGHNLNLIIKNSLKSEKENIQTIMKNIEKVKDLVTLIKRKGIMRKFAQNFKSIPQSIETRFNSIYLMLKIFVEVYDNLKEFLVIDRKLQSDLLLIDEDIIKELVPLLEIFDKTTLIVSQNSSPTIHLVIQLKRRLLSLLKSEEKDSQALNELKAMLTINVEKYLKIQFIHKLALIFDPKRKDLKF
jgi:hypothetical protein